MPSMCDGRDSFYAARTRELHTGIVAQLCSLENGRVGTLQYVIYQEGVLSLC